MKQPNESLLVRFLRFVKVCGLNSTDCWVWTGTCGNTGYGQIGVNRKARRAHRVAWEFSNGPIPTGTLVLHVCDNPRCVRPSHLWLGTQADNLLDMARKHRGKGSRLGLPYGVMRHKNRYKVVVWGGGRTHYLGSFSTIEEAAYVAAAERERLYDREKVRE